MVLRYAGVPKLVWGKHVPVSVDAGSSFVSLHRAMNPLLDDFFHGWGVGLAPFRVEEGLRSYRPLVDVAETEKEVRVTVELPGMDEKEIEVSLSGDLLTVQGEKRSEQEDQGKRYYRLERAYGAFHRVIPLPVEVAQDQAAAAFKDGVLSVTLPKIAEAKQQAKRIPIKTE